MLQLVKDPSIPGLIQLTGVTNPSQDLDPDTEGEQSLNTALNKPIPDAEAAIEAGADVGQTIEDAFEETFQELLSYDPDLFGSE